jgi:hypothetical protein
METPGKVVADPPGACVPPEFQHYSNLGYCPEALKGMRARVRALATGQKDFLTRQLSRTGQYPVPPKLLTQEEYILLLSKQQQALQPLPLQQQPKQPKQSQQGGTKYHCPECASGFSKWGLCLTHLQQHSHCCALQKSCRGVTGGLQRHCKGPPPMADIAVPVRTPVSTQRGHLYVQGHASAAVLRAVQQANMPADSETGRSKGFGFVSEGAGAATAAAQAIPRRNGAELAGRRVNVLSAEEGRRRGGSTDDRPAAAGTQPQPRPQPPRPQWNEAADGSILASGHNESGASGGREQQQTARVMQEQQLLRHRGAPPPLQKPEGKREDILDSSILGDDDETAGRQPRQHTAMMRIEPPLPPPSEVQRKDILEAVLGDEDQSTASARQPRHAARCSQTASPSPQSVGAMDVENPSSSSSSSSSSSGETAVCINSGCATGGADEAANESLATIIGRALASAPWLRELQVDKASIEASPQAKLQQERQAAFVDASQQLNEGPQRQQGENVRSQAVGGAADCDDARVGGVMKRKAAEHADGLEEPACKMPQHNISSFSKGKLSRRERRAQWRANNR